MTRPHSTRIVSILSALVAAALLLVDCTPLSKAAGPGAAASLSATREDTPAPASPPSARPAPRPASRPVDDHPRGGARLQRVDIPSRDGFAPRPAYLYLPPAAIKHPHRRLPVLELLHGTPGGPVDWTNRGLLVPTLDAFTAAHHGEAPIIVMPDLNGALLADSQCIRTAAGADTEHYLTSDVVSWVRRRFPHTVGHAKWWVAGLSEGGVCSLMLALRHPRLYSALGDLSGLAAPLVDHLTPTASDRQLYRGNQRDKREHEPLWLLAHGLYPGMRAWFECGSSDRHVLPQQAKVVAAAQTAQLLVRVSFAPGKHGWPVWSAAFKAMLPWLWSLR